MNVKLETVSRLPVSKMEERVEKILAVIPAEHLRGFSKIVFVETIMEPRLSAVQRATLPALYHPKVQGQTA